MAHLYMSCVGCVTLSVALASWQPCFAGAVDMEAASGTVLSGGNSLLAAGAIALQEGRVAEGIRLTQEGLKEPTDSRQTAAAHSNLCAGFVLLREWAQALEHCNMAIELDRTNWQPFNNRAAVHAGLGQYDLALADLRSGLELDPRSSTLHKSLAVVEHNQRIINKRDPSVYHS